MKTVKESSSVDSTKGDPASFGASRGSAPVCLCQPPVLDPQLWSHMALEGLVFIFDFILRIFQGTGIAFVYDQVMVALRDTLRCRDFRSLSHTAYNLEVSFPISQSIDK